MLKIHVKPTTKDKPTKKQKTDPLAFKSNSKIPMCYFSNLFGGAEFTFMSLRTNNMCLKHFYEILREIDWDSAEGYRLFKQIRVQMGGKDNDYYLKPTAPPGAPRVVAGLLAKLISNCYKKSMKKRLVIVNELAGRYNALNDDDEEQVILASDFSTNNVVNKDGTITIRDDTASNKKKWMMEALGLKYANPFFRELLLNSQDGIYERKGPRDTKLWCGNEYTEDAAGQPTAGLLMQCLADTKTFYQQGETKE
jgi:hypothetical protein